ncbi:MAG: hypothetical protein ACT4PX_11415 [Actinomycetota bacterium]
MNPSPPAVAYRLAVASGRYRWTTERREAASAVWRDHCWDVHDVDNDRVLVSLVAGPAGGAARFALVDHQHRRAATFVAAEPMTRSHIGAVCDTYGRTLMVVRADGPTGLHVIDPTGQLLALTSRHRDRDTHASDVLVTALGAEFGSGLLFGVTLALELMRAGALRRVA